MTLFMLKPRADFKQLNMTSREAAFSAAACALRSAGHMINW